MTSRLRVLIVDDEAIFTQALRRLLQRSYDIEVANDGAQALAIVCAAVRAGKRFDAIISDVSMPSMNGIELYEAITHLDEEQARHFVFLTGGAFGGHAQTHLSKLGMRQLEKPVDVTALRHIIAEVAGHQPEHGGSGGGLARTAE